jgi:hypothetical protein
MLTPSDDAPSQQSRSTWAITIAGRPIAWPANRTGFLYLAALLFVLFWGIPRVVMPLATDQFYFALGARTILDGDQMYRDLWDLKPPLIYFIYAIPAAVFGEHVETFRLLDLGNTLLAMAGVFLFTRRLFEERAAVAAAALYGFAYLTASGLDGMGQSESFMVAPLMLGLALYPGPSQYRHTGLRALGAGLLIGLAIAVKPSGAVFLLALPAMELLLRRDGPFDLRGAFARLALAGAGAAAVQLVWLAYLLTAGVLDDFIDLQRGYLVPYTNERWAPFPLSYPRFMLEATAEWFRANAYLLVLVWAAFVLSLYRGRQREAGFVGVLCLLGLISVWWQGKFFLYHWLVMLPLMAPLAGWAVDQLIGFLAPLAPRQRYVAAVVVVVGFCGLASAPLLDTYDSYRHLTAYASGSITREQLDYEYVELLEENRQIADHVRVNSGPDEGFYVWGFWTATYYWADRPTPSQYITSAAVRATWSPSDWREELVTDLREHPPRFFAVAAGDRQPWLTGTDETSDEHFCNNFPELRNFIEAEYAPVYRNALFVLYERGAEPAVTTWCGPLEPAPG